MEIGAAARTGICNLFFSVSVSLSLSLFLPFFIFPALLLSEYAAANTTIIEKIVHSRRVLRGRTYSATRADSFSRSDAPALLANTIRRVVTVL